MSSGGGGPDEAAAQENIKAFDFTDSGPPPDLKQRGLIFDSLQKIVGRQIGRQKPRGRRTGESRGTFIFTWGAGYHGQLGRKFTRGQKKYSPVPLMVDTDMVIRQVTCGGLHTALVTEHGDVYTWGDGRKGQLGHPNEPSQKQVPKLVKSLSSVHVVQVACGSAHTICLTDTGVLWSWGNATNGQPGHGERQIVRTPKKIDYPDCKNIVAIACGNKHCLAINADGESYSWGCGEHGQTGHLIQEGDKGDKLVPTKMDLGGVRIASIACGSIHSCLISEEGDLYLCGFGEYFYPGETQHFFYKPKLIEMPEKVQQVACGQAHNVALTVSGCVYTWGSGEYGQLGYGIKGNASQPRMVLDDKNIAQVGAGRYHSFALATGGQLYSWGCGENGQLGLNSDENICLPTVVTRILPTVVGQVACGEHHTAVLTSAPWTKLSQDTAEWLDAEKNEQELKKAILRKTHRGLNRKDLIKVKEEMRKWHIQHEKRKSEKTAEEEVEIDREINSIQDRDKLAETINKDFMDKGRTTKLPEVAAAESYENPDEQWAGAEKDTVKLPKVHKKKEKAQSNKTVVRMDGGSNVPDKRASSAQGPSQPNAQQAPLTRTAFLKDSGGMLQMMKSVVQEKGEATNQKELQRMIRLVFAFRKEYDAQRNESRSLSREVEALKKEYKLLVKSGQLSKDSYAECYDKLKALEMQLNTVTIKILETAENRKNYELNITNLKDEDFEIYNQLKALRKQNQDNNNFLKKMNELKTQAVEERDQAEAELDDFRKEIGAYQKFVNQQLQQFESILGIVRSQSEKREKAKQVRQEKTRSKIATRIDKLQQEAEAADKEAGGLTARLTSLDLKLRHFEDSFQKITAATGLTNPDAIVNKFFFKGEIKEQLEAEIEDKQAQIEQLKTDEKELKQTLTEAKAGFKHDSWRDIDILSENNREKDFTANMTQGDVNRATERLNFAQEGLASLISMLNATMHKPEDTPIGEDGELWTEEQTRMVFEKVNAAVDVLMEVEREREVRMTEEETQRKEEEKQNKLADDEQGYSYQMSSNAATPSQDEPAAEES